MSRVRFSRFVLVACVIAPAAVAQIHPYFGVEIGTPLTDTLMSSSFGSVASLGAASQTSFDRYNSETKRLLIGPTFRLDLVRGLGIEFDALYQRIDYDFLSVNSGSGTFTQTFQQTTSNKWEFPLLVQYEFHVWKSRPFLEVGPSVLHITQTKSNITTISNIPVLVPNNANVPGQAGTWAGFTTGGGVDVHWSRFHLRPEVRYSRWFSPTTGPISSAIAFFPLSTFLVPSPEGIHLNQNEASFLLGLTF
jgi:hypothetical protein